MNLLLPDVGLDCTQIVKVHILRGETFPHLSFLWTWHAFLEGIKTQTRRLSFRHEVGQVLWAIQRGQGLGPGGKVVKLDAIRVADLRTERLDAITQEDVVAEGFPDWSPQQYIEYFCSQNQRCKPSIEPVRIVFERFHLSDEYL